MLRLNIGVLVLVLIAGNLSFAQSDAVATKRVALAQRQLENVRIEEEDIGAFFSQISFAYDIPIGLEIAHNGYELKAYRIDLKKGTLSDLLTQFVAEHKQYDWKIENGVLSVFPKEEYRDLILRELLSTNLSSFSVKPKTTTEGFGRELISTPEINKLLELYGVKCDVGYAGGFYIQQLGQRFALDVSNRQLKSLLDEVIKKSPVAKTWVIANDTASQEIVFRIKAALEYSPEN